MEKIEKLIEEIDSLTVVESARRASRCPQTRWAAGWWGRC